MAGPVGQLIPQLSLGYGFSAIICVFLGGQHPLGMFFAAVVLAVVMVGAESLQIYFEFPAASSATLQGLILFYLLISQRWTKGAHE